MRKLLPTLAIAGVLLACGGWKAQAATITNVEPLTKNHLAAENVGYWRRHYRRGYYGYGYPYYGYGYRPYGYYGYGWRPGFSIYVGPRWGWGY